MLSRAAMAEQLLDDEALWLEEESKRAAEEFDARERERLQEQRRYATALREQDRSRDEVFEARVKEIAGGLRKSEPSLTGTGLAMKARRRALDEYEAAVSRGRVKEAREAREEIAADEVSSARSAARFQKISTVEQLRRQGPTTIEFPKAE